jgi:hypothetical protein
VPKPKDETAPEAEAVSDDSAVVEDAATPDPIPVSSDIPVTPESEVTPVQVYDVQVVAETPPAADADAATDGADTPPRKRRGLKWLWVTLLSLLIAGLIALSVYMIVVTQGWQEYSAELEGAVEDLRATAADDRASLEATQSRLDTVQGQLDTANQRITDLANEEANATDTRDILRDYMVAMISCADGRQELIDVLTNSQLYFPGSSTAEVERELVSYCDSVKNDYNTYLAGS